MPNFGFYARENAVTTIDKVKALVEAVEGAKIIHQNGERSMLVDMAEADAESIGGKCKDWIVQRDVRSQIPSTRIVPRPPQP